MAETKKKNKKKKVIISEVDIAFLLRRYSAKTIITFLQEIAQFPDAKIDWNDLAKKSSTGIKNGREYQMIWRHLAYRDTLLENVDEAAEPVDDDSDLETDLEAFPAVNGEASAEAASYAKILLDSGLPGDFSSGDGPLTINIPNEQPPSADPDCAQGRNMTISVFIKSGKDKSGKDTDGEGGSGLRRKRKPWTEEEDLELIAAVQKCGERNWANIVKGDFKGDRTASQLSQRWSIIRKKLDKLNTVGASNASTTQLTEAQLATRRAVSHALNMQIGGKKLLASGSSAGATQPSIPSNSEKSTIPSSSTVPEKSTIPSTEKIMSIQSTSSSALLGPENTSLASRTQPAPPHTPNNTILKPKIAVAAATTTTTTTVAAKKSPSVPFKPVPGPNPMIQATAVAAGARIAPPSTAASLLKAAQSKNAVHIRPGGSGPKSFKTSLSGGAKTTSTSHLGSHPNVHYIRTGLAPATAPATYSAPSPSVIPQVKPATVVSSNLPAHEMGSDTEMKEESPKNVPEEFVNKDVDESKEKASAIDKGLESDNVNKPVETTANPMDED